LTVELKYIDRRGFLTPHAIAGLESPAFCRPSVFVMTLWTEGVAARSPYAWAQDKLRDEAI